MKIPGRAIVLCAGFGTRMSPLSDAVPKPLMPLWGKPLVEHTLGLLCEWGVTDVLVNLHHAPAPLFRHLVTALRAPPRINFSFEPDILGTGGALRRADWFVRDEPFWIVNGDIAIDVSPKPFVEALTRSRILAALWVTAEAGPLTVDVARGMVRSFAARRPGGPGTFTFCGLHLARPRLLEHAQKTTSPSIIDIYNHAMSGGAQIAAVCPDNAFWSDAGTVDSYIDTHRRVLERHRKRLPGRRLMTAAALKRQAGLKAAGVVVDGFACVGENVTVARGAHIRDAVIWDGAHIGARARVAHAIIGEETVVRGAVERMAVRADRTGDPVLDAALGCAGFPPGRTVLQPLAPRGSARSFTRAAYGRRRAMVMQYSLERPENGLYEQHTRFLERLGMRVPGIILSSPGDGLLLLEDAGELSLLDCVRGRHDAAILRYYRKVIDAIVPMHRNGAARARRAGLALAEPFTVALYAWEHRLFASRFLRGMLSVAPSQVSAVLGDLRKVSRRLLKRQPSLIHRDLQSTNILFLRGSPVFIDFQGMRIGAAEYDLASLLCDPYVCLPCSCQNSLLSYYAQTAGVPPDETGEVFWYAAVQRLVQAIGAYARLGNIRGTARFVSYIVPALTMLGRAMEHVPGLDALERTLSGIRGGASLASL